MEENVVNTNVAENPVVTPEVVETAMQTAIEPVQVPQIAAVPMPEQKTFLGLDSKTWTDIGVLSGATATGVILDRVIPWAFKKAKEAFKNAKEAYAMVKNGANAGNQNQQPAQEPANENPVAQQPTETTPVTPQENK